MHSKIQTLRKGGLWILQPAVWQLVFHLVLSLSMVVTSNSIGKLPSKVLVPSNWACSNLGNSGWEGFIQRWRESGEIFSCMSNATFLRSRQKADDSLLNLFSIITLLYWHMAERCRHWWNLGLLSEASLNFSAGWNFQLLNLGSRPTISHGEHQYRKERKRALYKSQLWRLQLSKNNADKSFFTFLLNVSFLFCCLHNLEYGS